MPCENFIWGYLFGRSKESINHSSSYFAIIILLFVVLHERCYASSSVAHIPLPLVCHRWTTCQWSRSCICSSCKNNDNMSSQQFCSHSFPVSLLHQTKVAYSTVNNWIWKQHYLFGRLNSFSISCILIFSLIFLCLPPVFLSLLLSVPLYFFSGLYPVNCLPPVPELNQTVTHQAENLTADIALATHQDEDGDTYVVILKMSWVRN